VKTSSTTNTSSALDYSSFGMVTVVSNWSGGSEYRFGFNGKEQDSETYGDGNIYDYGFRIYNPILGKFLSVDPISIEYPDLTPYQFTSNRPIDGIDLDGFEYLDADESRVEFKSGEMQLKIENFMVINQNAWKNANNNPNNWSINPVTGKRDIGISRTLANITYIQQDITKPVMADVPDLPESVSAQSNEVVTADDGKTKSSYGTSDMATLPGKGAKALNTASAVIEFVNFAFDQYMAYAWIYDKSKVESHTQVAVQVGIDLKNALNDGLIPSKYQNLTDITNIMNVVLSGVNNTSDKEIYNVGILIYNTYNPSVEIEKELTPVDNTNVIIPVYDTKILFSK